MDKIDLLLERLNVGLTAEGYVDDVLAGEQAAYRGLGKLRKYATMKLSGGVPPAFGLPPQLHLDMNYNNHIWVWLEFTAQCS